MKKYYIAVDLEGCACVVGSYGQGLAAGTPNYAFSCQQGTAEAVAASNGLFKSGADEVCIWDCHGTGVNLDYNAFDKRCTFAMGAGSRLRFPGLDSSYDGVIFIGYHAYDSIGATLAHVYSSSTYTSQKINGKPVGELQIDASVAGKRGVPVLLTVCDDICAEQAKESFPWIKTVITKKALAWNSCISKHPSAVCDEIEKAAMSVANEQNLPLYTIQGPFEYEVSFKRIEYAQGCSLRNPDNTLFERVDAYTLRGTLNDTEHIFQF